MSKAALKEIREAIKAQRYKEGISKCEELLKTDPKNSMIYILLGAAYQDSDKAQAADHLRKAVEYADGPPVTALQGLANCAPQAERPVIYEQLLDLVPDKYAQYYDKLYALADSSALAQQCFDIFKRESQKHTETERQSMSLNYLAKIWNQSNIVIEEADERLMLLPTLKRLFEESETGSQHLKMSKRFLKLLFSRRSMEESIKYACLIVEKYPSDEYAYDVICLLYCETYAAAIKSDHKASDSSHVQQALTQPVENYAEQLLQLNRSSDSALFVKAIKLYEQEQYVAARDILRRLDKLSENLKELATYLLATVAMQIGAYVMAARLWLSCEGKTLNYAVCLSFHDDREKLQEASLILEAAENGERMLKVQSLARCYSKLHKTTQLQALESELDEVGRAEFLLSAKDAINELLKSNRLETYEALVLLGNLHLKQGNISDALSCMLKVTRLRPYRAECFFYLGQIYQTTNDLVRARKCLEKCVSLDPLCEKAVYNLSGIYQELKEEDLNFALLVNTLEHMGLVEGAQRLHYKLGLHYLIAKKYDDAIRSFRTAIKFDVGCIINWESLADTYAARGSYRSAIRVFQKILEMDDKNVYARFQIALLKTTLRMYTEAIEDFDGLLQEHPDYLPGLKGVAEAHIGLAYNLKADHLYGRCKVHLQHAASRLQRAFLKPENQNMVWLWRLTATVFVMASLLPTSLANLEISGALARRSDEPTIQLMRSDLLNLAMRFYTCALKLKPNTFLWYELTLCCYYSGIYSSDKQKMHLETAEKASKMAIKADPSLWQNWNFLGVLYMHPACQDLPLAQHCFITALTIDRKLYTVWSNLGALYFVLGEIRLANQAFQRSQQSNPIFGNAWIGQAMIAEAIGVHDEALDLYRHCLQFDYHPESSLGYANGVCDKLINVAKCSKAEYKMLFERMYADVVALDEINWYVENEEENASASTLSIQGFLSVHQKLYHAAERAYQQAVKVAEPGEERNKMLENLGYVYLKINEPQKALDVFNMITKTSLKAIVGLAMAYSHLGLQSESYKLYENLVSGLEAENESKSGHLLVAMAAILYSLQGEDDARTLLYQCILLDNSPIEGLYSACALGILHHDIQLTQTILDEFKKYEDANAYCATIAYLASQAYLVMGNPLKAVNFLKNRVHLYPHLPELRRILADFLLKYCSYKKQLNFSTSQVALSAVILAHRDKTRKNICEDDAKLLIVASRALRPIKMSAALKYLQRALHLYPKDIQVRRELQEN